MLRPLVTLLLASALVGCTLPWESRDPPLRAPGDPAPARLAELEACRFAHADGSRVPCEDDATRLQPGGEAPPGGWTCVGQAGESVVAQVWRDGAGRMAFSYQAPGFGPPVSGVVLAGDALHAWSGAGQRAFLPLPENGLPGQRAEVTIYHASYASDTPALAGGTLDQIWTLHDGKPYPVHRIQAQGKTYYPAAGAADYRLSGEDYSVTLSILKAELSVPLSGSC